MHCREAENVVGRTPPRATARLLDVAPPRAPRWSVSSSCHPPPATLPQSASVPGFRLGLQDLSDFRIGFAESHTFDPGFRHEYGGILGPDLLHYHEALIDFGNRALYLKPDYRGRKR
jgi:hypothetical protein